MNCLDSKLTIPFLFSLCSIRRYSSCIRHRTFPHDSILPLPRHSRFPHCHSRLGSRRCDSRHCQQPRKYRHPSRNSTSRRFHLLPHLLRHCFIRWSRRCSPSNRSTHPLLRQTRTSRFDSSFDLRCQVQHGSSRMGNSVP